MQVRVKRDPELEIECALTGRKLHVMGTIEDKAIENGVGAE